jgi:hypothetical protein
MLHDTIKNDLKSTVWAGMLRKYNSKSLYCCSIIMYFLLCNHRIFLFGHVLKLFSWTTLSGNSTGSPTTYRAANRNRIDAIVCKHTTIEDGCVSVCVDVLCCWQILSWILLSYSWAYLKKKLLFVNILNPTSHVMHQQFNIQQLYVLPPKLYLCENKQRFVPLTA